MAKKVLAVSLAFLYSIVYIVVGPMVESQEISFNASLFWPFIFCFALCSVVNILIFSFVPKWRFDVKNESISAKLDELGDRRLFFLVWAFIFVSWIPAYLILYPGVLSYDFISQSTSAMGNIDLNHHPVLHTWLIRVFMKLGYAMFSCYEYGIGILSLLQMLVLSYALSRLVMLLKKKRVPILIVALTAFFSAIWFMNACLGVTMIKDTLHVAFLVLFVCHFTEIVTNPREYFKSKRNLFFLPVVSFLMCAFRNNGIHIYLFCFGLLCILRIARFRKAKKYIALIAVIILPVVLYEIYTGPVFSMLGIRQGQVREALSVPIQQLQRVAVKKTDELTAEQMELMDYYIDNLEWRSYAPGRQYDPFLADPAKGCFYSERYEEDPIAFWKFYLQTGMQFKKEYVAAFLSNTLGYWYPGYYDYSYVMYENYSPEVFVVPLERKSIARMPVLEKYYESLCSSDFWRETPVLRFFVIPAFSIWILMYALILAWKKREYFTMVLPLFFPLIAQYGIMILSPMSSFRYSWPFYLMLPISFVGIWGKTESLQLKDRDAKQHPEEKNEVCSN